MNIFSCIKQRLSILDVVSEYITLKKAGLYHKGCCPFHHEKTASFTVSPHKEIFYCFGCHVGGDVISFISHIENCSQLEAAKLLAERYQLELPQDLAVEARTSDKKKRSFRVNELVAQWCHELLLKSPAILRYLYGRGIDKECIVNFNIGYFPGGFAAIKALIKQMLQHQILADDLLEAHIIRKGKTTLYSPFEQRIIFPITDHIGHYCGFGGRIYKKEDTRAKYYNSQENEFFNKGSLLYGLNYAKEAMQKKNVVFLVEGYTDCIAMAQHGYKNTVAILGTACTLEHLKMLARYVEQVYVVYDNDKAGQQAILRLTELCWQVNLELKVIQLPEGEDPASCLKKQIDMTHLIRQAQDVFHFFIQTVGVNFSQHSLNQKLQTTRKITALIASLNDGLKQDILLQEAAKVLKIPYQTLKDDLKQPKIRPSHVKPEKKLLSETISHEVFPGTPKLEKKILSAILNNTSLLHDKNRRSIYLLLPDAFTAVLKKLETILQKQPDYTVCELFELLDDQEKQLVSQILLSPDDRTKDEGFECLLGQLQKKYWKSTVNDIKIKLETAQQQGDEHTCSELIQKFVALKKMMLEKEQ